MQAKPGLSSLDAISMLRRQSSAFRVACGNTNSSRINAGRPHHVHTAVSSSRLQNGVDVGQPLPSSLASWFSWLRAGGAHYGGQPSSQQFPPGMLPCRGVLPPSNPVPAPATHHQQAPRYNCEACGKSYSTFGGLSKHKQFHCSAQIKKDFRCKYCDKSYSSLGALKMHIRTHTLPCKCNVCGKAFSRPWLLQGHLRTHTGEKPFSCQHCARAFADRSNLRAHLQTHSDVKKYSCRHCSKTFSRMSLLVKHRESSCVALHR
ncbi:protein snail homolog Sna-like [Littorina saxatilis]